MAGFSILEVPEGPDKEAASLGVLALEVCLLAFLPTSFCLLDSSSESMRLSTCLTPSLTGPTFLLRFLALDNVGCAPSTMMTSSAADEIEAAGEGTMEVDGPAMGSPLRLAGLKDIWSCDTTIGIGEVVTIADSELGTGDGFGKAGFV